MRISLRPGCPAKADLLRTRVQHPTGRSNPAGIPVRMFYLDWEPAKPGEGTICGAVYHGIHPCENSTVLTRPPRPHGCNGVLYCSPHLCG